MAAEQAKLMGIAVLVIAAVGGLVWSVAGFVGEEPNDHIPNDFPHAFIAAADNGHPDRVVVVRARMAPTGAQEIDGHTRWPAWSCANPTCPGRVGDQLFIFAYGDPAQGAAAVCPRCSALGGDQDPTQIGAYMTPEAEAILAEVRARY